MTVTCQNVLLNLNSKTRRATAPDTTTIHGETTVLIKKIVIANDSILDKWWKGVCVYSWITFIAFELAVGLDRLYNEYPLCPYTDINYGVVYWNSCYACLGGFVIVLCTLIMKVFQLKGGKRVPLLVSINIVSMGTIATALALIFEWGGVCIDGLGVASPAALWGE